MRSVDARFPHTGLAGASGMELALKAGFLRGFGLQGTFKIRGFRGVPICLVKGPRRQKESTRVYILPGV